MFNFRSILVCMLVAQNTVPNSGVRELLSGASPSSHLLPVKTVLLRLRGGMNQIEKDFYAEYRKTGRQGHSDNDRQDSERSQLNETLCRELQERDLQTFANRTGLNMAVCKAIMSNHAWNLQRALNVFFGKDSPDPLPGEKDYDPGSDVKLYGPKDLRDFKFVDDMLPKLNVSESLGEGAAFLEQFRKEQRALKMAAQPPPLPLSTLHELRTGMTEWTLGTAACGIMFDIEAISSDIALVGIQASSDLDRGYDLEYTVRACRGSWLDAAFQRRTSPDLWQELMAPRGLRLADNPLIELPDGNVELSMGQYSNLPFDENLTTGQPKQFIIRKGEVCGLCLHGRDCAAIVYRHPVRDIEVEYEVACEKHGLEPLRDDNLDIVQYTYRTEGGNTCPVHERMFPEGQTLAGFAGVIQYRLLLDPPPANETRPPGAG